MKQSHSQQLALQPRQTSDITHFSKQHQAQPHRLQQLLGSSSQRQLSSFESPSDTYDFRLRPSQEIEHHRYGSSEGQQIQHFLTSSGEDFDNGEPYSIGDNTSAHQKYTLHTHNPSSSLKNVPMSYSSTQSQGNLQSRFQQLGNNMTELGSPITATEGASAHRREELSGGGITTNKKSVKFEDQSESKIKIYDESRFIGSEAKGQDGDTSSIIQAKINTKINEINNKYFQSTDTQHFISSHSRLADMLPQSQTLQILDQENTQSFGETKVPEEDENSMIAMEDAIEEERQRVHSDLNKKYFSNERSQYQHRQSANASSYSFEQLREQVMNQQDERGTTQKLLSDLQYWQRPSAQQSILMIPSQGNTTQKLYEENNDESILKGYQPLRSSRSRSGHRGRLSPQSKEGTIIVESYRDYANKLKSDHKSFENKLQSLKSKIQSIQKTKDDEPGPLSRQLHHDIITTPTMQDLSRLESQDTRTNKFLGLHPNRTFQDTNFNSDIMMLQPSMDRQTITSSRQSSKSPEDNQRELKSKIDELKQTINAENADFRNLHTLPISQSSNRQKDQIKRHSAHTSSSRSRLASRNGSLSHQGSFSRNLLPTAAQTSKNQRLKLGMKDTLERIQETDLNQTMTSKIKWLEKRNQEYSQRLKDLVSEKREHKSHIQDLEQKVQSMQRDVYSQNKNTKWVQEKENRRIEELENQISELKMIILRQNKENKKPVVNQQEVSREETPTRLRSLQTAATIQAKKAPLIPLRQSKDRQPRSPNKSYDRIRSLSKPKDRTISSERQQKDQQVPVPVKDKPSRNSSKIKKKKKTQKKSKSRSKSKDKRQMGAIITHLTDQIANLQVQVKTLEKDKADWQSKANQLSTFYFGALKELKNAFYEFRDQTQKEQKAIQEEFKQQLGEIVAQAQAKEISQQYKSNEMVIEENGLQDESIAKLMNDSVIENRFKRKTKSPS